MTNKLTQKIATLKTDMIVSALREMGGGLLDSDRMNVRTELLKAYEARQGEDAVDALMDELGL